MVVHANKRKIEISVFFLIFFNVSPQTVFFFFFSGFVLFIRGTNVHGNPITVLARVLTTGYIRFVLLSKYKTSKSQSFGWVR